MKSSTFGQGLHPFRLQNSPYFCLFKYARAVKQKVWNEAENRERDWGFSLASQCEARALRARKTLTPRFTDFFTDFEKKNDCFAVYNPLSPKSDQHQFSLDIINTSLTEKFMRINKMIT